MGHHMGGYNRHVPCLWTAVGRFSSSATRSTSESKLKNCARAVVETHSNGDTVPLPTVTVLYGQSIQLDPAASLYVCIGHSTHNEVLANVPAGHAAHTPPTLPSLAAHGAQRIWRQSLPNHEGTVEGFDAWDGTISQSNEHAL